MSKYSQMVAISSIVPFNVGLASAREATMISVLGRPKMPLTTDDQPDHASDLVKKLATPARITSKIKVTGIRPAIDSLRSVLQKVKSADPNLVNALSSAGMLVVRLRRPTSGRPSSQISNHSWGTAIDFSVDGHRPIGDSGQEIPRGIAMLIPYFNAEGWYSGVAFHDDMHFEISEEKIRAWATDGTITTASSLVA